MAGIIASRPRGRIRGKDVASGLGTPKKRGNKPNGPTWPVSPWKGRKVAGIGTQWAIRAETFIWTIPIPWRDEKR